MMFKAMSSPEAVAQVSILDGMCGVNMLQRFRSHDVAAECIYVKAYKDYSFKDLSKDNLIWNQGGCGWLQVAYIDGPNLSEGEKQKQQRVYNILAKRFPKVFESEKRLNKNSQNQFWFVIYDMTKEFK